MLIVDQLRQELAEVREELRLTKEELRITKQENVLLKLRIDELSHRKGSNNSSLPPSADFYRKSKSLREKSGKSSGGQKGHDGHTLTFSNNISESIDCMEDTCPDCGLAYTDEPVFKERRQVIDIPPIIPQATEYKVYERKCTCGKCSVGTFPEQVKSPVSYGRNIETLCGYFSVRQYISTSRIKEMFKAVFNLQISEGTIVNKTKSLAQRGMPRYNEIKNQVQNSSCVGTDETGCKINGRKSWIWTWQNRIATYIVVSPNRGYDTIAKHFEEGFENAILVHDCWKAHFKTSVKGHQICLAHILRELQYFIEKKNKWSYEMSRLFLKSMILKKKMLDHPTEDYSKAINQIHIKKTEIIATSIDTKNTKLTTLIKRLIKYDAFLFTFLQIMEVPPDNNFSEQAIRNVKVKLKVSGQFRSEDGASHYAIIRSIIDTAIKNKESVLNTLANV